MKTLDLTPDQIITLNDYPVHSINVLKDYISKSKSGELPLVPVIRKDHVLRYFDDALNREFQKFENQHSDAKYFMLDGSHRTTALTLANRNISTIIFDTDSDILEAKKLLGTGRILENGILECNIQENCEILFEHYRKKPYFMTVKEKAEKMRKEGLV